MISTHILDTSLGCPASDVIVKLEKKIHDSWIVLFTEKTNADGRISFNCQADKGVYRLEFQIDEYFKKNKITPFFICAPVTFEISDIGRKYHIPLLLNPYGYSTYRGS